jgi:Protein of unknown function (DUF1364)
MSKITLSAKGEACTIRIIGYCNGNPETTVLAHINGVRFGHGTGQKVNDILAAYACSDCHEIVDGRQRSNYTRSEIKIYHYEGVLETQTKLIAKGLI